MTIEEAAKEQALETIEELEEIKQEMLDLLLQARTILLHLDHHTYQRANSYWLAHIETAISRDNQYLGGSMCTFEDTIRELRNGQG